MNQVLRIKGFLKQLYPKRYTLPFRRKGKLCLYPTHGFTLPEVIVVSFIAVVLGGLLMSILVSNTGIFYQQTSRVQQGLGINDTLLKFRGSIKEALGVVAQYPPTGTPNFSSGPSTLVLKVSSLDGAGNIVTNTFDYIVYFLEEGRLHIKVIPDSSLPSSRYSQDTILSNNVSNLTFQYFDAGGSEVAPSLAARVKITLRLNQKAGAQFESNIATSEASLRND